MELEWRVMGLRHAWGQHQVQAGMTLCQGYSTLRAGDPTIFP